MLLSVPLVTASLLFDGFRANDQPLDEISYSPIEIIIGGTSITVNDKRVTISGLDAQSCLLCFREGSRIFPNSPMDQTCDHELGVEEDDLFVWTKLEWQPASFLNDVYARFSEDQIDLNKVYQFKMRRFMTLQSRVLSKINTVKSLGLKVLPWLYALGVVLVIIMAIVLIVTNVPKPIKSHSYNPTFLDPCADPTYYWLRGLYFRHNNSMERFFMFLEEEKPVGNCTNFSPMMTAGEEEQAFQCIQERHPNLDPGYWELMDDNGYGFYTQKWRGIYPPCILNNTT